MQAPAVKGIRDFEAKRKLLAELITVSNFAAFLVKTSEAFNKTLTTDDVDSRLDIEQLRQTAQKWSSTRTNPSTPEGKYLRYWDWIINGCLGLHRVTTYKFFRASFVEFASLVREQLVDVVNAHILQNICDDPSSKLDEDARSELKRLIDQFDGGPRAFEFGRIDTPFEAEFEGVQSGIIAGHVRAWHCFLTPEAARQWNTLVENGNYAMYSACLATLGELLQSRQWRDAVAGKGYSVGVALAGGGSPEKDVLLASALAKLAPEKVQYCLVDVSPEMITHSQCRIVRALKRAENASLAARIELLPAQRIDILKMPRFFQRRHEWYRVVWSMLGGTIGNLPEREFFESIAGPSRAGDLMIVGLDTHDGETWQSFQERIRTQYQGEEVYDLLLEGRQGRNRDVKMSFHKVGRSDVPGSWVAVFNAHCDGREVVVTSTRYLLPEFLKFANQRGWQHLHTVVATGSTFRQMLFRRI